MKKIIILLFALFLFVDCGTKTKTQTETKTEIEAKETAKSQDSLATMEKIILSKVDEKMKELEEKFRQTEQEEETKKTTITTKETIFDNDEWQDLPKSGKTVHKPSGRLLETKTVIEEKRKAQKETDMNIKLVEKEKIKKDSTAIATAIKTGIKEGMKELSVNEKTKNKEVVQKGWQPGFWFYFWIFIILVLIALFIYLYRKFGTPMGWFGLLFGAFKRRRNEE